MRNRIQQEDRPNNMGYTSAQKIHILTHTTQLEERTVTTGYTSAKKGPHAKKTGTIITVGQQLPSTQQF
jgi:hypothetical protein